ncbi:hypothetical protein GCM10009856_39630 [Mycolicibacterium llatzerense]
MFAQRSHSGTTTMFAPAPIAARRRIRRIELYLESVKDYSPPWHRSVNWGTRTARCHWHTRNRRD